MNDNEYNNMLGCSFTALVLLIAFVAFIAFGIADRVCTIETNLSIKHLTRWNDYTCR